MSKRQLNQRNPLFQLPSNPGTDKGKVVLFFPTAEIEQNVWFPFPYLYLGPFIELSGYSVTVIDARVEENWRQCIESELRDCVAFGITSMSGPDLNSALEAAHIVRESNSNLPIIWGGHHVSPRSRGIQPWNISHDWTGSDSINTE